MAQANPSHERLWEQLVEALYQVGRTAEALAGCRSLRQHLDDEYGIVPGPGLQQLEMAILRGETIGASPEGRPRRVPGQAGATAAAPPPRFPMPGDLPDFTGRAAEITELHWRLTQQLSGPVVAVISGPPGIGKTALATHLGHLLREEFPGGCRFVPLASRGSDADTEAAAQLVTRIPRQDTESGAGRILTIVDGAQNLGQVIPFLPAGSNAVLVITSRLSLAPLAAARGASLHRLAPFDPADSQALLRAILGPRLDRDASAASELAALCGHFPVALRIAGTRLTTTTRLTLPQLTERLRTDPIRLLSLPGDPGGSVAALFGGYLERLDAEAADAFYAIGSRGPEPLTLADCAKVLDLPEQSAEPVIERLIDLGLLENEAIAEYRMQDLLCAFARARTEDRGYPND